MIYLEAKSAGSRVPDVGPEEKESLLLPTGVLGFENFRDVVLESPASIKPFHFLRSAEAPNTGFVVVDPIWVVMDYKFEIADADAEALGIQDPSEAGILNIAVVRPDGSVTINLKGPIVYNRRTRVARQVVPLNAAELSVHHPVGN